MARCGTLISVAWKGLKSCFLRKKLFVWFPGKLCLEECALAVAVGDGTECTPRWLVSSLLSHICVSLWLPLRSRASFDKAVPFYDWSSRLSSGLKEIIVVLAWYVKTFVRSIFMDSLIQHLLLELPQSKSAQNNSDCICNYYQPCLPMEPCEHPLFAGNSRVAQPLLCPIQKCHCCQTIHHH